MKHTLFFFFICFSCISAQLNAKNLNDVSFLQDSIVSQQEMIFEFYRYCLGEDNANASCFTAKYVTHDCVKQSGKSHRNGRQEHVYSVLIHR